MAGEPHANTAVEYLRRNYARSNKVDSISSADITFLTDDFTYEDRSRDGANFGTATRDGWIKLVSTAWDVGTGRPRRSAPEVVAIRGERCAAVVSVVDFGNQMLRSKITVFRLDRTLRKLERIVSLDAHAKDEAVDLVEQLHAEIDQ